MSKALWAQMADKCKSDDGTLHALCQLMWNVAVEKASPCVVRDFLTNELAQEFDD